MTAKIIPLPLHAAKSAAAIYEEAWCDLERSKQHTALFLLDVSAVWLKFWKVVFFGVRN